MTLDAILATLFPDQDRLQRSDDGLLVGRARLPAGPEVAVIGVGDRAYLGVDQAVRLAGHVLRVLEGGGGTPVLVLIDSGSQRMSLRDELLGLAQALAHLAKTLLFAEAQGHSTLGLLYGNSAAGAFIATALATGRLAALPGAEPAVMDLPSMARVTKLSVERLQAMARDTPVFAPGLDNFARTGAVHAVLDPDAPLAPQVVALLAEGQTPDRRDSLGRERNGRVLAADVAARVQAEASVA